VSGAVDLAHLIRRAGRRFPRAGVIEDGRNSRHLRETIDRAERLANALDGLDVPPQAAVAVLAENRIEFAEIDFALLLARRVRVALNARLHVDDFEQMLADSQAVLLIHSSEHAEVAQQLAERVGLSLINLDDGYEDLLAQADATPLVRAGSEEDPAWISYTSGTTGKPKGVVLSRRALRHVGLNLLLELDDIQPGEQLILTQPLSHGAGYFVIPYLLSGAGLVIQRRFDPEMLVSAARRPEVRSAKIVPAMLPPLLELSSAPALETLIYGGSAISKQLMEASLERFGPLLVQIYGQSEAPMTLTFLSREDHVADDDHRLSAGQPWRSVALEARDPQGHPLAAGAVGEIYVAGDHMMTGYLSQPDATAAVLKDGWLATRDMGYLDERGYVFLMGRLDDMIISGGFNIAPREVELELLKHPAISDCAVYGSADPRWGAAVHVAVVATTHITGGAIIDWARPRLGFRTPKQVHLIEVMPRNAYGKVDRESLTALSASGGGR
jgi:fatty-acyl-CoA synthase